MCVFYRLFVFLYVSYCLLFSPFLVIVGYTGHVTLNKTDSDRTFIAHRRLSHSWAVVLASNGNTYC